MSESSLFKPQTGSSGIGKKAQDKGQFANPPAYPEVSGFSGPSAIKETGGPVASVQKSPSAQKGRV
jgi:hypothetical protein